MSLKRPPWMSRIDIVLFLGFTYSAVWNGIAGPDWHWAFGTLGALFILQGQPSKRLIYHQRQHILALQTQVGQLRRQVLHHVIGKVTFPKGRTEHNDRSEP